MVGVEVGVVERRGLELLRPQGRFVELGKRDILDGHDLPLRSFSRNLSFFGVDITSLTESGGRLADDMVAEMSELVEAGVYRPLPHMCYRPDQIAEALSLLRESRHIGKIVISFDPDVPVPVETAVTPAGIDPDATYLVTGGLGGPPLTAPISVFGGDDDPIVAPESLEEWAAYTTAGTQVHVHPGGHHYLRTAFPDVIPELTRDLLKAYRNVHPHA